MPEKKTLARARRAKRRGMSPTSQAGEFVHEEIHHVRQGKHGARSTQQAIAIGLSKARRAGVKVPAPRPGTTSSATRKAAKRDLRKGRKRAKPSPKRSRAMRAALKRAPHGVVSKKQLARQARAAAKRRGPKARKAAAKQAARTRQRRAGH
jgi:hypothetical protein